MAGVASEARDLDGVRAGLQAWLRSQRDGDPVVGPLVEPSMGFSSQTLVADVTTAGVTERVVARLPPAGAGVFPAYDLGLQARVQLALAERGIPVAPTLAWVEDDDWVGVPFLVMGYVAGQVPTDQPPYWESGWLRSASPAEQAQSHGGFLSALAEVHALDPATLDVAGLARPQGPGLAGELAWWQAYLDWAGDGSTDPELADALAWCVDRCPSPEPAASLLWGDVRLGNVIFADGRPAALLDWEMTSLGPPEMDLAWYLALRRLPGGRAELPGFPDRAATIEAMERGLGRALVELEWFEAFALARSEAILGRIRLLLTRQGLAGAWLTDDTPMRRRLRRLVTGGGRAIL